MGKALMGAYATPRSVQLLDEVRALRQRVAQLEQALAEAEAVRDARLFADPDDGPDERRFRDGPDERRFRDDELVSLDEAAAVSH